MIHLDCGQSEQLCSSSENTTLNCSVVSSYIHWSIDKGSNFTLITIFFRALPSLSLDTVGDQKVEGDFTATFINELNAASTLTFNSSLVPLGTKIKCTDNENGGTEQCIVKANGELL